MGSRRELEEWIEAGRITINRQVAKLGDKLREGDTLSIDGRPVPAARLFREPARVLAYYKPPGIVCSRKDPEGRPTIFQQMPARYRGRWVSVGRLDLNTSGLLLLTNDGELANRLMHPSAEVEREYAVRVLGKVDDALLQRLTTGVVLDDGVARFDAVQAAGGDGANRWFHVTLREGRNREVRRLWESQGVTVSRLIRFRYGTAVLPRERHLGDWWELEPDQVGELKRCAGLTPDAPEQKPRQSLPPRSRHRRRN
jgi:23S rRNA pseudouridine2605 synthase